MLLPCPRAKVFLIPKVSAIKVIQILTLKTNVTDKCDKEVSENLKPCRKLPGMSSMNGDNLTGILESTLSIYNNSKPSLSLLSI